ncbi:MULTISPECIES: condensin complex protein MksE [Halomonadaceae]|uniref:condensin complex protein MksE n=1 Tax=Halomonadaceae TaxID=28256 RepID=UPI0003489B1C|nr:MULTISPECIES: hypothetical protein [Halomonas]
MSQDELFRDCVERLLKGEVICPFSAPELYNYMARPGLYPRVEDFLGQIGRGISRTRDGHAFYAVYRDTVDQGTRSLIRNHFERLTTNWEGLLRWLRLARQASESGHPLYAGDIIRESDYLAAIENSTSLQEELEAIASKFGLKGKGRDPRHRLSHLLDRLEKDGFLQRVGTAGTIFKATGRWSILWDQLEFVYQQEGILDTQREQEQAEAPDQEGLFHGSS